MFLSLNTNYTIIHDQGGYPSFVCQDFPQVIAKYATITLVMQNPEPPRNPLTRATHRRETRLQITLPLLVGVLAILGLAVYVVIVASRGGDVSHAADTSLIFVLIPAMITALLVLAILVGLVYLVASLINILPPKLYSVQLFFERLRDGAQSFSDKIVEPSLRIKGLGAGLNTIKRTILGTQPQNNFPDEGS